MSFLGFLGGVLKGGLSIATHGLVNLGGAGSSGGGVGSAAALSGFSSGFGFGGPRFGGMPAFSPFHPISSTSPRPGAGSSLIPHFACGAGEHHAKRHGHHLLAGKCVR